MEAHPLRQFMTAKGWKQAEMAEFLEVKPATLSRWLNGKRQIDRTKLPVISQKTGIPGRDLRPDLAEAIGAAA